MSWAALASRNYSDTKFNKKCVQKELFLQREKNNTCMIMIKDEEEGAQSYGAVHLNVTEYSLASVMYTRSATVFPAWKEAEKEREKCGV